MKLIKAIILIVAISSLSSCNTLVGVGRDIKQLGGGIESKGQGQTYEKGATTVTPN